MKKKILVICGGLLAVFVIAAGVFNYYVKPRYVTPLVLAVEEFLLEDEDTLDLLIQEYEKSLTEEEKIETTEEEKEQKEDSLISTSDIVGVTEENNDGQSVEPQVDELKKNNKKKVVIGSKSIDELQKEVAPNDLKAAMKIASKIDTGHLTSLAKGGLTKDDKEAAKSHLRSRLTSSEYNQLKVLVGKYAYLLK